jgi:hypothetical protein
MKSFLLPSYFFFLSPKRVLRQTGHEDDEGDDYEYKDDDSASEASASASAWSSTKVLGSKKHSQVFQFYCDRDA